MRSTGDQELFKPLSNRTRTRPEEMYSKFSTHLTQLQDQVAQFNKAQQKMAARCHPLSIRSGSSQSFKLKSMTQPKYQELLLTCQLPNNDKPSPKRLKLQKKFSTKSGKSFNSFGMGSSITNFMGFKSNAHSKVVQSKLISWAASKSKSKTGMQSTMLQTNLVQNPQTLIDNNLSVTESIVFNTGPDAVKVNSRGRLKVKDLRQLVQDKQMQLENEWGKTERYRCKVNSYLGEEELVRLQKSTLGQTRIVNVIDKIKRSRVATAVGSRDVRGQRMFSES